jgi:hypothetical protein
MKLKYSSVDALLRSFITSPPRVTRASLSLNLPTLQTTVSIYAPSPSGRSYSFDESLMRAQQQLS